MRPTKDVLTEMLRLQWSDQLRALIFQDRSCIRLRLGLIGARCQGDVRAIDAALRGATKRLSEKLMLALLLKYPNIGVY